MGTNNGASTLIDLAVKAGLAETLTGDGPFTVFAPTNAAFAALPADLVAAVTNDVELLKKVLLYLWSQALSPVTKPAMTSPSRLWRGQLSGLCLQQAKTIWQHNYCQWQESYKS